MSALRDAGSTRSWRRLRALVLDRDAHRCTLPLASGQLCGAFATHVDHVVPRSKGGSDALSNLRAACRPCNLRRGDRQDIPDAQPVHTTWRW